MGGIGRKELDSAGSAQGMKPRGAGSGKGGHLKGGRQTEGSSKQDIRKGSGEADQEKGL